MNLDKYVAYIYCRASLTDKLMKIPKEDELSDLVRQKMSEVDDRLQQRIDRAIGDSHSEMNVLNQVILTKGDR